MLSRCALLIDGRPFACRFDQIGVPPLDAVRRQAATIQLFADAPFVSGKRKYRLVFRNSYRPARGPTMANIFAAPQAGGGYAFELQQRSDDDRSFAVTVIVH